MKALMKYQLVLQLPGETMQDYDKMIELEKAVIAELGGLGKVDGHDMGSGEMNIFIDTDGPERAFKQLRGLLASRGALSRMTVAYRDFGSDDFTILHPLGATKFSIA
jgi:hypothetical protein